MRDSLGLGKEKGVVYDIQRFSVSNGSGIRTTVYLKGCTLRCRWCHNPEGVRHYPEVFHYWPRCTDCGRCDDICPANALGIIDKIEWGGEEKEVDLDEFQKMALRAEGTNIYHSIKKRVARKIRIQKDRCIGCLRCVDICPERAFVVVGRFMTVDEVMDEVTSDKIFYKTSGGGITISGGEPTAQPDFTLSLLKRAKEAGIHTALDTNGYLEWDSLKKLLDYTDLVLYDIKSMDPETHKDFTGVDNKKILDNAKKIAESDVDMRIRFPLIPGINDGADNIKETAKFTKSLGIEWVDMLPYHAFAGHKYRLFSLDFPFPIGEGYPEEKLTKIRGLFESFGLNTTIGG